MTYANLYRFREAAEAGERAIRLDPGSAEAHYRLGRAYCLSGRHEEAAESLRRAVSLRPRYAEAHSDLGAVYLLLGKKAAALDAYRRVRALSPELAVELYRTIYKDKILSLPRQ